MPKKHNSNRMCCVPQCINRAVHNEIIPHSFLQDPLPYRKKQRLPVRFAHWATLGTLFFAVKTLRRAGTHGATLCFHCTHWSTLYFRWYALRDTAFSLWHAGRHCVFAVARWVTLNFHWHTDTGTACSDSVRSSTVQMGQRIRTAHLLVLRLIKRR